MWCAGVVEWWCGNVDIWSQLLLMSTVIMLDWKLKTPRKSKYKSANIFLNHFYNIFIKKSKKQNRIIFQTKV